MNAIKYFAAPLMAMVSIPVPSAYGSCPDFANKTVVIDFSKGVQFDVDKPGEGWGPVSLADFNLGPVCSAETGCLTFQFKRKNKIKWMAPGKMPMRCSYKSRGSQTVEITIKDEDDEDDGTFCMTLWVVFNTAEEGYATGEVWIAGRTYCLKGLEVRLQNGHAK